MRKVRRASRGRRSVSAGPGAPLSPPGPACRARCPPSPGTPTPGLGRRAPLGRSPRRSSSVPVRVGLKGQLVSPAISSQRSGNQALNYIQILSILIKNV